MKRYIAIFSVGLLLLSSGACKKCTECKAEECPGGVNSEKKEFCGNASERESFEKSWTSTYSAAGCKNISCD